MEIIKMCDQHKTSYRRYLRIKNHDYSQAGAYFVTICTQDRLCLFGDIVKGEVQLNTAGQMIQRTWENIQTIYFGVSVDTFIVMPNHIHGILILHTRPQRTAGQARGPAPTLSLPNLVQRFKSMSTRHYIMGVARLAWPAFPRRLWQRNYYEHIVRNENSLHRIREYISSNPQNWPQDRENPYSTRRYLRGQI